MEWLSTRSDGRLLCHSRSAREAFDVDRSELREKVGAIDCRHWIKAAGIIDTVALVLADAEEAAARSGVDRVLVKIPGAFEVQCDRCIRRDPSITLAIEKCQNIGVLVSMIERRFSTTCWI